MFFVQMFNWSSVFNVFSVPRALRMHLQCTRGSTHTGPSRSRISLYVSTPHSTGCQHLRCIRSLGPARPRSPSRPRLECTGHRPKDSVLYENNNKKSIIIQREGYWPLIHSRLEQSAPNHSGTCVCPDPRPTGQLESHKHPNIVS
jgi:hypothetical protein